MFSPTQQTFRLLRGGSGPSYHSNSITTRQQLFVDEPAVPLTLLVLGDSKGGGLSKSKRADTGSLHSNNIHIRFC